MTFRQRPQGWAVLAGMSGAISLLFAVAAFRRARLPYDEEGNFFDGLVSYHQQSVEALALFAVAAFLLAMACWYGHRRSRRIHRSRRDGTRPAPGIVSPWERSSPESAPGSDDRGSPDADR